MSKRIQIIEDLDWGKFSAIKINNEVIKVCERKGFCNIMLTGGRSASIMYDYWADIISTKYNLNFYFGDERCVSPDSSTSNFFTALNSLFKNGIHPKFHVERIYGEAFNLEIEAKRYESILPNDIDILLLSIGEDAHIASLFPGNFDAIYSKSYVEVVSGPKFPFQRITITPKYIRKANIIFTFACGFSKNAILKKIFNSNDENLFIPARLVLNGNWLIDSSAADKI